MLGLFRYFVIRANYSLDLVYVCVCAVCILYVGRYVCTCSHMWRPEAGDLHQYPSLFFSEYHNEPSLPWVPLSLPLVYWECR